MYAVPAAVVSLLGAVGYLLALFAMRLAPVSRIAPSRLAGAACILLGVVSLAFAQ
jgi:hypothetical protein